MLKLLWETDAVLPSHAVLECAWQSLNVLCLQDSLGLQNSNLEIFPVVSTQAVQLYFSSPGSPHVHCSSAWLYLLLLIFSCSLHTDASLPVLLTCFLLNFWHCSWLSSAELMALKSHWFRDEIHQKTLKNLTISSGAVISTWTLRETHACWSHMDNNYQPRYLSFHVCSYLFKNHIYFQCIFSCPLISTALFVRVSPGIY